MTIESRLPEFDSGDTSVVPGAAITVGTFDGVHRGHRDVLQRLVERARERGLRSVAVTFDPHPLQVVNPAAAPLLLSVGNEKLEALAATGLDHLVVIPFTPAVAALSAEAFVDDILCQSIGMRDLLIGHDHGFGRHRAGNASVLQTLGESRGFSVEIIPPVSDIDGHPVSSTAIRRAVTGGELSRAAELLGRPYSVSGTVVHGEQRGRALGFPTLNLSPADPRKLLPPDGIYAARVQTPRGTFDSMLHLGPRPTFGDPTRVLEAYLFDTGGDFYDLPVRVDFIEHLREVRSYSAPAALVEQIRRDEIDARAALSKSAIPFPR